MKFARLNRSKFLTRLRRSRRRRCRTARSVCSSYNTTDYESKNCVYIGGKEKYILQTEWRDFFSALSPFFSLTLLSLSQFYCVCSSSNIFPSMYFFPLLASLVSCLQTIHSIVFWISSLFSLTHLSFSLAFSSNTCLCHIGGT